MTELREAFVGIDVAKLRNAVAIADAGRDGEVRYIGEVDASPESKHRRFKSACSATGHKMVQEIEAFIDARTSELEAEAGITRK